MSNSTTPPLFLFISRLEELFLKSLNFFFSPTPTCSLLVPRLFFPFPWCGAAGPWSKYRGSERVCPRVHCCHYACLSLCMPHLAFSPPSCLLLSKSLSPCALPMAQGPQQSNVFCVTQSFTGCSLLVWIPNMNSWYNFCTIPLIFLAPLFSNPCKPWWWWEETFQKPLVT